MPVEIDDVETKDVYDSGISKINANLNDLSVAVNNLETSVSDIQTSDIDSLSTRMTTAEATKTTDRTNLDNHLDAANPHGLTAGDLNVVVTSEKGAANGVATLDSGGKVPTSELPATTTGGGISYQGTWDASTNTPTLPGSGYTSGDYYIVSVDGTVEIDGGNVWNAGDWIIHNGERWTRIGQSGDVSSVAGKTGAVTLVIGDVGTLQTELDDRVASTHTHPHGEVTDFPNAVANNLPSDVMRKEADARALGSGSEAAGRIPISDGAGGITWAPPSAGSGDMDISVYDANGDNVVDVAETLKTDAKVQLVEQTTNVLTVSAHAVNNFLVLDMNEHGEFTIFVDDDVTILPLGTVASAGVRRAGLMLIGQGGPHTVKTGPDVLGDPEFGLGDNEVVQGALTLHGAIADTYFVEWTGVNDITVVGASTVAGSVKSGYSDTETSSISLSYDISAHSGQQNDIMVVALALDNSTDSTLTIERKGDATALASTGSTPDTCAGRDGCAVILYQQRLTGTEITKNNMTLNFDVKHNNAARLETYAYAIFLLRDVSTSVPTRRHLEDVSSAVRTTCGGGTMDPVTGSIVVALTAVADNIGKDVSVSNGNQFTELVKVEAPDTVFEGVPILWVGTRQVAASGTVAMPVITTTQGDHMQGVYDEFRSI